MSVRESTAESIPPSPAVLSLSREEEILPIQDRANEPEAYSRVPARVSPEPAAPRTRYTRDASDYRALYGTFTDACF